MTPFFVAGLIVMYGINAGANAMMDSDEFKNDPRELARVSGFDECALTKLSQGTREQAHPTRMPRTSTKIRRLKILRAIMRSLVDRSKDRHF